MIHIYTCCNEPTEFQSPICESAPMAAYQRSPNQPGFQVDRDKKCRLSGGEYFAKSAIGHYCNTTPGTLVIERDGRGKPFCSGPQNAIHFNLSHSGRWIVCAVARRTLGIDIQKMTSLSAPQKKALSQKILTEDEHRHYAALPDSEQSEFLYRTFSMKESCVKAVGLGLEIPFSIITLQEEKNYFTWEYRTTQYFIREYFPDPEYKLFLCSTQRSVAEIQSLQ